MAISAIRVIGSMGRRRRAVVFLLIPYLGYDKVGGFSKQLANLPIRLRVTWRLARYRGAAFSGRSRRRALMRGSAKSKNARNLTGMNRLGAYTKLTGSGGG